MLLPGRAQWTNVVVVVDGRAEPAFRSTGIVHLRQIVVVLLGSRSPPSRVLLEHSPAPRLVLASTGLLVPLYPLLARFRFRQRHAARVHRVHAGPAHAAPRKTVVATLAALAATPRSADRLILDYSGDAAELSQQVLVARVTAGPAA